MAVASGLPDLPRWYNMRYTFEDGTLTSDANFYNDQMNQTLSKVINNGIVMPSATTAQLTLCRDDVTIPVGTVWFCTDLAPNGKLVVKTLQAIINPFPAPLTPGAIEQVTSTAFL